MSDIGGKIEPKDDEASLSIISLRWMVHQIKKADCGIIFDRKGVSAHLPDCLSLLKFTEEDPGPVAIDAPTSEVGTSQRPVERVNSTSPAPSVNALKVGQAR